MAYIDYPITCIAADSYRENPERGSTLHRAEDGTPWVVNLWPETRYTFEIVHPALSAEEQLELEQFYEQHIGDEVRWFNPRRQNWWRVRMVGPPRLSGMRSGLLGDVEMTLVGEMVDAPTNSVPPVVSGLHQIGQVISVSQGTWQSEYPMQFEYQWLRNGEPIAGATDQNYTLVDDDLFNMISVRVTASSFGGSTSVETEPVMARLDSEVSWLYSDMAETIFVDTSGNTPAALGDPVGLIKDSSGNGNDFTQPTVTARPILGRVPRGGRRNTVSNSTLLGAGYAFLNVTGILDGTGPRGDAVRCTTTDPEVNGYLRYTQDADKAWIPGDLYRTSIAIKNIDAAQTRIRPIDASYSVYIDWSNPLASGITPIDGWPDWYLVEITAPAGDPSVVNNRRVFIYPQNDAVSSGSILVSGLQVEVGEETTPYQLVNNEYDVTETGVPDVYCLNFDGTDDLISTVLPAINNGTIVLAGPDGIWIDDEYNFAGGTFSIGPTSYTNGPDGILTAIGEPIVGGFLVINRQLSQLERDLVIQEMKECGAPGVFGLGPELTLLSEHEGTPITDPGDNSVGGTELIATSLLAGVSYRISYTISGYDGDTDVGCTGAATTGQTSSVRQTSNGSYTMLLTPTVTGDLSLFTRRRNTATFSNISVRELELIP